MLYAMYGDEVGRGVDDPQALMAPASIRCLHGPLCVATTHTLRRYDNHQTTAENKLPAQKPANPVVKPFGKWKYKTTIIFTIVLNLYYHNCVGCCLGLVLPPRLYAGYSYRHRHLATSCSLRLNNTTSLHASCKPSSLCAERHPYSWVLFK